MRVLGVRDADVLTRVSEYVPQVVKYVEKIIERGYAYESNGSVYFDVQAFRKGGHPYAKLRPWSAGNEDLLAEGEGALAGGGSEKRNSSDFALWKGSKPGEPFWDSPWGKGRPGWHIECSAMASDLLGENFDVHSGGEDLAFPHHDNEIAQAEAFFDCKQWVNYFLHAGHLNIDGLKMSKSLKNFITIRQALELSSPRQIRLVFLLQSWDRTMNYSDEALKEAAVKEKRLKEFFLGTRAVLRKGVSGNQHWSDSDRNLHQELLSTQSVVHERLCDNFDFSSATARIFDLISKANTYMNTDPANVKTPLLGRVAGYINRILKVFGVVDNDSFGILTSGSEAGGDRESIIAPFVDSISEFRQEIRSIARSQNHKEYLEVCDVFRNQKLVTLGVRLEDKVEGSVWKLVDPAELKEEMEKKAEQGDQKAKEKAASKLAARKKDLEALEKALRPPASVFEDEKDQYSQFDADGIPTHDKDGVELKKGPLKKLKTKYDKQKAAYDKVQKDLAADPEMLQKLRKVIADLELLAS
eukprot:TRINITY_DN5250_c0_g1_i2.p1 TRINITY_DN5250_c0_g1~~TRINITY_DN5250_c0_g1_i2.p1  ORF type:complete len:527 (-),score=139.93 TRINITY_DN5250_c0_g1_i2:1264-2844(-)